MCCEQALEDALGWAVAGHPIGVAVNVSATLLADHGFMSGSGASSAPARCRPSA
jgi:hypothetical protein